MKDLVCYSLDVNIPVQNDAAEKRLFNHVVEAIDYYCLVQPPTPTESVFLWLAQLSPLVDLSTDPDRTKSENLGDNCGKKNGDMSNQMGGEELVTKENLVTEAELVTKKKFETKEEIETKDLESPEELMSAQFDFFGKGNLGVLYGRTKTDNWLHWS